MKYFDIPVIIVAQGETLEEAQQRAYLFMPWTTNGGSWDLKGHDYLVGDDGISIDSWHMSGVDPTEMEGILRENGWL